MKNNRVLSFIIIGIIYAISIAIGIIIYNNLSFHFAINFLIADVISTIIVFIFNLIFKNSSVYDPYWSVKPIVVVLGLAFTYQINISRILALIAILLWGVRLTLNWAYTFKNLNHQDWRYTMLKEKTGMFYPIINLLGIHMFPTVVVYLCMLPVMYLFNDINNSINVFVILFFIISVLAFAIQGIADYQMHKFRKNKNSTFIRNGLWKYSRHPNYLGEIMMWFGIAGLSICSIGHSPWLFIGAIVNLLMFLFVSIPMAENHQKSRKEHFDEYKAQTRMLLPIKK